MAYKKVLSQFVTWQNLQTTAKTRVVLNPVYLYAISVQEVPIRSEHLPTSQKCKSLIVQVWYSRIILEILP